MSENRSTFTARVKNFLCMPFPNELNALHHLWRRFIGVVYYRRIFASFGEGSALYKPLLLSNTQYIHIGKNVLIREGARLEGIVINPSNPSSLYIGNNVNIEQNVHIICHHRVAIASNVSIAPMCSIMDTTHPFDGIGEAKVGNLLQDDDAVVEIGDGSWIGIGAVILPNVRIGKRCVIGANAVVTRDIPDRSVAVGSPARVIRTIL